MSLDGSEIYEDASQCASMMDSDVVNSLNHTTARKKGTESSCAPKFCSWSFRLTIKSSYHGVGQLEGNAPKLPPLPLRVHP